MEGCSCDRVEDMLLTAAAIAVLYPVIRLLAILLGLDVAAEKTFDVVAKHKDWLGSVIAIAVLWWWFFS